MGAKGFEDGKVVVSGGTFVSTGDQQVIFTDSKENTSNDVQVSGGTYEGAIPNEDYIVPGFGLNKNPDGALVCTSTCSSRLLKFPLPATRTVRKRTGSARTAVICTWMRV